MPEMKTLNGYEVVDAGAVRYDEAQTLTDAQKAQARENIGVSEGNDGFSPTISATEIDGGQRLTITDVDGEKTVDIMDGADGADGTSVTITAITESTESGGENVVTFSDGQSLKVKNGKDVPSGEDDVVPDYWTEELETKADAIRFALESAGRNKSSFLWYTDSHWTAGNSKVSPSLLKYLYRNTPINKVNFGGDIAVGNADRQYLTFLYDEWRSAIRELPNHHSVVGNHDAMIAYPYTFVIAPEESPDMVMGDDFYYYIDNPCEKTRYLYLDSGLMWLDSYGQHTVSDEETKWLIDTLTSTPSGWHVVAISHAWFEYTSTSAPTVGCIIANMQTVLDIFDAYNARQSGSVTMKTTANAYDFTSCEGKVEFCIGGHIHVDYDLASSDGIPVILTASDTNQDRSPTETEDSGTLGTITESAVFGIIADYTNNKITVVGVGRGGSRVIPIGEQTPSYTNILTASFTHNGTDYDAIGYEDGMRLSTSAGNTKAADGRVTTGFIPVSAGDVIRIKGMTLPSSNDGLSAIAKYDENKAFLSGQGVAIYVGCASLTYLPITYADGLITINVSSNVELGFAYIRVTGQATTGANCIVTVNEEIS